MMTTPVLPLQPPAQPTLPLKTGHEAAPRGIEGIGRNQVVRALEVVQDIIVVVLSLGVFCVMVLQLKETFVTMFTQLHFREVTADILFLLILVEVFRLLVIYLQEHRVSIGVAVEVAIVSVLREVIVRGILEIQWSQVLGTCAFLIVMALLLVVRVWLPPTFEGVDPEKQVSLRRQQQSLQQPVESSHL